MTSQRLVLFLSSGRWWEPSCAALKLWQKSCWRNVPNTQTWILEKPNSTSTRKTSEQRTIKQGLLRDYLPGLPHRGIFENNDDDLRHQLGVFCPTVLLRDKEAGLVIQLHFLSLWWDHESLGLIILRDSWSLHGWLHSHVCKIILERDFRDVFDCYRDAFVSIKHFLLKKKKYILTAG